MSVPDQGNGTLAPKVKGSLQSCIALQLQFKFAQTLTIIDQRKSTGCTAWDALADF
jgi:hypothetical protein